jgi:hypothetical protein
MANMPSKQDAETLFWRVMRVLLILGVASGCLRLLLVWRPASDNQTGRAIAGSVQHLMGGWLEPALWLLGIGLWAGAIALCALLLKSISDASFLKAAAAMWRPLALLALAGYLLFFNDQGRELGISLLGEKYVSQIIFLAIALIYWAANTWHTARLGIHAALERGELGGVPSQPSQLRHKNSKRRFVKPDDPWLFWAPRLLGVCAHLFAAINLSLAAWALPIAVWGNSGALRLLAWTAPVAIALATAFVWAEDVKRSIRANAYASADTKVLARRVGRVAISGEIVLLCCLAVAAWFLPDSQGFLLGTIFISLSAVAFLAVISWLRNRALLDLDASAETRAEDDERERKEIEAFTLGLLGIACLVAVAVWISPTGVGRFLGSMVVVYFAFGAILALVNAFEFAVVWTTRSGWYSETARPRVVGAYAVAFMIGLAALNAWLHPFHRVRLCDGGNCVAPPVAAGYSVATLPNDRPKVADAAKAWYQQAKAAYDKAHGDGPVPMFIVAAAGGGIRAAYWTATILDQLETDFATEGGVRPYLFAISGVSGGSVGAAAFEAALTKRDETHCVINTQGCPVATGYLTEDFLAPALASWIFEDTPSSFLPDFGQGDRGVALEKSFEHASGDVLARPFLSFFRLKKSDTSDDGGAPWWRPILLLNATHEETGNRVITAHVRVDRNVFLDSLDALHVLGKDVRASTAAHNSARFTYVSPAGDLGNGNGSVIDGGYFENYGALSALELARAAKEALKKENHAVKLVFLLISSDPSLEPKRTLVRIKEPKGGDKCLVSVAEREERTPDHGAPNYLSVDPDQFENPWLNEFVAPLQGVTKVREAHGNRAAAELAVEVCAEFPDAPKAPPSPSQSPQTEAAATLDLAKDVGLDESESLKAKANNPYFAHLAMCTEKPGEPPTLKAPLGWVLSRATQKQFPDLLGECGNDDQLHELEHALGKQALQHDAERQ